MGNRFRIVVLQRGWVLAGRWSQQGDTVTLTECRNIRRWGTTRGLGQLATSGPTDKTVQDPQPDTSFHILTVVQAIDCEGAPWPAQ